MSPKFRSGTAALAAADEEVAEEDEVVEVETDEVAIEPELAVALTACRSLKAKEDEVDEAADEAARLACAAEWAAAALKPGRGAARDFALACLVSRAAFLAVRLRERPGRLLLF